MGPQPRNPFGVPAVGDVQRNDLERERAQHVVDVTARHEAEVARHEAETSRGPGTRTRTLADRLRAVFRGSSDRG